MRSVKFRDYRIRSNKQKEIKAGGREVGVGDNLKTAQTLILTWSCFHDSVTRYGHVTRLSWPETRVKMYFWVEIMACHTQNSWHFILFINARPIPQNHKKGGCRSETNKQTKTKQTNKRKKRKDLVVFLLQNKSRALNRTLISFSFPHKFWFLSWSFIRHSTDCTCMIRKRVFHG